MSTFIFVTAPPTKRVKLASKPVCGSNWSLGPKGQIFNS